MTNNDILTLAKAGFTAQQIAALAQLDAPEQEQAKTPAPAPAPAKTPAPAPAPAKTPAPAPAPAPAPVPAGVEQILAAVQGLNANVQAALLQSSQQPGSGAPETAEQILASIINPPKFEGGIK